ncbi:MAG: GGDEF domain-containing protein [Candidatus Thiodiazotropha sp.]
MDVKNTSADENTFQIDYRERDRFIISFIVCIIGFFAHFSFIFLFHYWGVSTLSNFNILSSLLWAWALAELIRGHSSRALYIGSTEVLTHAIFATSVIGLGSGFDLYLLPLAARLAYHPDLKYRYALIAGPASMVLWVVGRVYWSQDADIPLATDTIEMIELVNITITGIAFVFVVIGARLVVTQQNRQLSQWAVRDELTGLYNRHFLTIYINKREEDGVSDRRAFALILSDLDHFKAINDKFGHRVGDKVLQNFSYCLQRNVRKEDFICRWGGEEFIVILPMCTLKKAIAKAEAIRKDIQQEIIVDGLSESCYISASFGVVLSTPEENFTDLVNRADKLLYQAKESGRNCVCAET